MTKGLCHHFLITLRLNFRSKQALIYGYLVPIFFLLAFGSVFRSDLPLLSHEMGQLLTISILGGACFGLPTALVAEREAGVWRRYRLLPVPISSLIASTLMVRVIIVASAAVMQVALARVVYGTPFPLHPGFAVVAFLGVTFAFIGLGLLVAAFADDVPAVQALGQCLFLPMIMIGGVGVPLAGLPVWVQRVAGFMPGRYAVDVLQRCFTDPHGLAGAGFSFVALGVIGAAAGGLGVRLFRWDAGKQLGRQTLPWIGLALLSWALIGWTAFLSGRLPPVLPVDSGYQAITTAQMDAITYDDLPGDDELVTRLAPPFKTAAASERMSGFAAKLKAWPPADAGNPGQSVRNLLSVAAIADISADLREAEIGRVVFDELQARYGRDPLCRMLAWTILRPDEAVVITAAPELGLRRKPPESIIRERCVLYAKKFLGRELGKISEEKGQQ